MKKKLALESLLAAYLLAGAGALSLAAERRPNGERGSLSELLLFWDEKDLYVESATRSPKPLSKTAENIAVVTAREIEDMKAHSVAEVLNRVTGVFVDFFGQDFGSFSQVLIQGSKERHVLVLVDGVPWNLQDDSHAETATIPVAIVERIEIIKGPGSSTWGSSLGGVVNVITKAPGTSTPAGAVTASYGTSGTQDQRAEVAGAAGPLGYYFHAGHQESDGLRFDRRFDTNSAYTKLRLSASKRLSFGLSAGLSEPDLRLVKLPQFNLSEDARLRTSFGTIFADAVLTPSAKLSLLGYASRHELAIVDSLADTGQLVQKRVSDNHSAGGSAKLVWTGKSHTVVLGADYEHGEVIQKRADLRSHPEVDKWAVFANDTISAGGFSVTPGFRFDRNSISGSFMSPSLGATYQLGEHSLARASIARGFTYPPLTFTSAGDGIFLIPNPDLEPEKVWSYQAGVETGVGERLWLKATAFYHRRTGAIERVLDALGPLQDQFRNVGRVTSRGVEVEVETAPLYNTSLKIGTTYVDLDPRPDTITAGRYSYAVALKYDDRTDLVVELSGIFKSWLVRPDSTAVSNGAIWDLAAQKRV
ncbi:MAG: TonB-dependent receptor, partial [Deltaproteobacteria bacterium]|nr:TonB-dependent receptor [Deltaproteobacteria bacterium]